MGLVWDPGEGFILQHYWYLIYDLDVIKINY